MAPKKVTIKTLYFNTLKSSYIRVGSVTEYRLLNTCTGLRAPAFVVTSAGKAGHNAHRLRHREVTVKLKKGDSLCSQAGADKFLHILIKEISNTLQYTSVTHGLNP